MFKIYYADGSVYSGDPYSAPVLGVILILESDENHGRRIIQNADYYCLEDRGEGEQWWESDFVGLVDYLITPGPKRILIGRLVPNSVHQKIFDLAYADKDFPEKTGWDLRNHGRKV